MRFSVLLLTLLVWIVEIPMVSIADNKIIVTNDDLKALNSDSLINIGIDYLRREQGDSALVYFAIVADRYKPGMSKDEVAECLAAINNCGLIYDSWHHEFARAYMCYRRALEICNQEDMPKKSAYAYHNLGAMFGAYAEITNSAPMRARSEEYFLKAIDVSVQLKMWHLLSGAFDNLLGSAFDRDCLDLYEALLERIDTLSIPSSYVESEYLHLQCSAYRAAQQGRYDEARQFFRKSHLAPRDSSKYRSRDYVLHWVGDIAQTFMCEQRYDSALTYYQVIDSISIAENFYDLSGFCAQQKSICYDMLGDKVEADRYYVRYLKLKDSILYKGNMGDVGDLQFMYELQTIDEQMSIVMQQKRQREQMLIYAVCFGLIIAALLGILVVKNRQLKERNRQLYLRSVELLHTEHVQRHAVRQTTVISKSEKDRLLESIDRVMNDQKVICASDFCLETLSSLVDSKPRYISEVINETYGKSFSILLSDQRVKVACRLIQDVEHYRHLTLEAISQEIGIKSRSTFTTAFKRVTGLTPSEYMRQARNP